MLDAELLYLKHLLERMTYVTSGDAVFAEHTNLFIEFATTALDSLKILYDAYKQKTNRSLEIVDLCIELAQGRLELIAKVRFGDVVATRDHNIIVDVLKFIEVALREIDANIR